MSAAKLACHEIWKLLDTSGALNGNTKRVLAKLYNYWNADTGQCNPRVETLAAALKLDAATIKRSLSTLRSARIISNKRGRRRVNWYTIEPPQEWPRLMEAYLKGKDKAKPTAETAPSNSEADSVSCAHATAETAPSNGTASIKEPAYTEPTYVTEERERSSVSALFPLFWACFVNSGIALNDGDKEQCRRVFENHSREEQERIGKWVIRQMATVWRSPEYTAKPINALRSRGWTRTAAERTVPKPPTREERFAMEFERRRAEREMWNGSAQRQSVG
jgi:hypothetical protein